MEINPPLFHQPLLASGNKKDQGANMHENVTYQIDGINMRSNPNFSDIHKNVWYHKDGNYINSDNYQNGAVKYPYDGSKIKYMSRFGLKPKMGRSDVFNAFHHNNVSHHNNIPHYDDNISHYDDNVSHCNNVSRYYDNISHHNNDKKCFTIDNHSINHGNHNKYNHNSDHNNSTTNNNVHKNCSNKNNEGQGQGQGQGQGINEVSTYDPDDSNDEEIDYETNIKKKNNEGNIYSSTSQNPQNLHNNGPKQYLQECENCVSGNNKYKNNVTIHW